ncbi:hypothetical protein [Actinoplanes regularis]|uniref:Flavin reductase n=1 Tax=Actinoplanes regularis TaxID=52697 RepID=A0A239DC16_9ACTN|nr:hypothetical protein [Actinoplanes regularis]GIE88759.1 hypothetical protein Are01nite_52390 [Actinoplanes regularis]SNS29925.1 hypothetical protein SAMN06264365_11393 [Actinoplanes regularis]
MTEGVEHLPARPSWDCRVCGRPWPCQPAQSELSRDHSRMGLAVLMWNYLEEAAKDMPQTAASELFNRFLRWTQ